MDKKTEIISGFSALFSKEEILCIIDGLPIAVAVIDAEWKLALANKMVCRFVNKNNDELVGGIGGGALGCIHYEDSPDGCGFGKECLKCKLRITVDDTLKNGRSHFMVETSMVFRSIGRRYLRITTQPLLFQEKNGALLFIEDVTPVKKYERSEIEKEKLTAMIRLAGAICHEINQPLMAILGFSELLMDDLHHGQVQDSNVYEIKEQAERLKDITNKLMAITHYKTKAYLNSEIIDLDAASSITGTDFNLEEDK